jgi:hypothetical protein
MQADNIQFDLAQKPEPIKIASDNQFTQNDLEKSVHTYVQKYSPKLYILTPCYGSVCYVNYVTCMMNTVELFRRFNFPLQIEFCKNDSLVSRARNNLIARAMTDPLTTHMLFIDADITWNPFDILKLILSDKPLNGGIYPLKHYQWGKLVPAAGQPDANIAKTWVDAKNKSQLKDLLTDEGIIQNKLLAYNVNYLDNFLQIDNNLAKVKHLATGFMLIQRATIEKMMKAFPSTKYVDDVQFLRPEENKYAYALFDCGVEEGHYYSEDWMFCHRWKKMGGAIFIDVSINLTHTGIEDYQGCYISSLL